MSKGKTVKWTKAMHTLCQTSSNLSRQALTDALNERFGLSLGKPAVSSFCKRHGYKSQHTGRFEKGHVPVNKGLKGVCAEGCEVSQFKKGNRPANAMPVGSRVKTDPKNKKEPGYWKIKIAEPRTWVFEHRYVWESRNGPVPKGYVIIFIDGNTDNVTIENLELVTRGELALLNKQYRWQEIPSDERKTVLLLARIQYLSGRLERGESLKNTENSLRQLCEEKGLNYATVANRISKQGLTASEAVAMKKNTFTARNKAMSRSE